MTEIKAQAQNILNSVQGAKSEGGAAITDKELGAIKGQITGSTHPQLLSNELNSATSNLTGAQKQELQDFSTNLVNTRAAAANTGFDALEALNNVNRINPFSWIINGHMPFTKPQ